MPFLDELAGQPASRDLLLLLGLTSFFSAQVDEGDTDWTEYDREVLEFVIAEVFSKKSLDPSVYDHPKTETAIKYINRLIETGGTDPFYTTGENLVFLTILTKCIFDYKNKFERAYTQFRTASFKNSIVPMLDDLRNQIEKDEPSRDQITRVRKLHGEENVRNIERVYELKLRAYTDKVRGLKEIGYPYKFSPQEYQRYLSDNLNNVKIGEFNLSFSFLKSLFIRAPMDMRVFKRAHTYIIGRGGSGKSELLKNIVNFAQSPVVVIDPHGDLADDLSRCSGVGTRRIAPSERRFVVNPFDIADKSESNRELVAQEITNLIAELVEDSGLSRLMQTIIYPMVYTLLKLPYADFKMLIDCINPKTGKDRLKQLRPYVEPHIKSIWEMLEDDTYDTSKQSVFNRLQSLLNYRLVVQTLCGRDDFAHKIEPALDYAGRRIIISLPIPTIGDTVAVTLGRFFMTRMQIWAKRRQSIPERDRFPVLLVVDEFHNFLSHATAETLDQFGRKFGLYMALAHQHIQQLTDREIRGSVLANTQNKIAGMSNNETRASLSKEMGIDPQDLENLAPGHFLAKFGSNPPKRFYSRMLKKSSSYVVQFLESQNGVELIDGWDGFDQEESHPPQASAKPKAPPKGYKPKFDI
jgi:hypothetical protein